MMTVSDAMDQPATVTEICEVLGERRTAADAAAGAGTDGI
jgi:hypothetical protein